MQMETAMSGHTTIKRDPFDVNKAIAAIGFLIEQTGASMYTLMKMMYLADKMHLDRYGRFIAGDHYVAMKQGPVPSCAYSMIKHVRGDESANPDHLLAREYFSYESDHRVLLKRPVDTDELSLSDVECLSEIAKIFDKVGQWAVRDMSHDDAWKASWRNNFFRQAVAMPIARIASQFESAVHLIEHLRNSSRGEAEMPEEPMSHRRTAAG